MEVPRATSPDPAPWPMPTAGFRLLVPGLAQWGWGQRGRGGVLFGSFLSSAVTGAFAWGTPVGLALLAFAFATHVTSTADALRQSVFPGLGRLASFSAAAAGLGLTLYAPALAVASVTAWPGVRGGSHAEGVLVNRWAYRRREPARDDWVWYTATPWGEPRLGRVVAGTGQEVEWSDDRLRVDGVPMTRELGPPSRSGCAPKELTYRVPEGHVLINPEGSKGDKRSSEGLVIVDRGQVVGRAWARFYPLRERRLLE